MRSSVLLHPLCVPLAQALTASGVQEYRAISICLGHLDAQALQAARESLTAINCSTGPTINDSLLISTRPPAERPSILARVTHAASTRLGYDVNFKYLPHLTKPDQPRPDLAAISAVLHLAPTPSPSDAMSSGSRHESSPSPSPPTLRPAAPSDPNPLLLHTPSPSPIPADNHAASPHPLSPTVTSDPELCSLCGKSLSLDDSLQVINYWRLDCPQNHLVCPTCATLFPHITSPIDFDTCVVCSSLAMPFPAPQVVQRLRAYIVQMTMVY